MPLQEARQVALWIEHLIPPPYPVRIIFHGGEPLLAGSDWFREVLAELYGRFGNRLHLSLQSNLWLLDREFCEIFSRYRVGLGTSLDGPMEINDAQRGSGYFDQTMNGIALARNNGLAPGIVCTFTPASSRQLDRIISFFCTLGLALNVHTVFDPGARADGATVWIKRFIPRLVKLYTRHLHQLQISNLDAVLAILGGGKPGICTYDCRLGSFLAAAPGGKIYPCNRFVGQAEWVLGSITALPALKDLYASGAGQRFVSIRKAMEKGCAHCRQKTFCQGGCVWQAAQTRKKQDPDCPVHYALFNSMQELCVDALLNLDNPALSPGKREPGKEVFNIPLLRIRAGRDHPRKTYSRAGKILAAAALGVCPDPGEAFARLQRAGIIQHPEIARKNLETLSMRLTRPVSGLGNIYLHITDACNLNCSHCYAPSNPQPVHIPATVLCGLVREAGRLGFNKAVLTGGEPTLHPDFPEFLNRLPRPAFPGKFRLLLRSNLISSWSRETVARVDAAVDELRVSLDGDRPAHDARRGKGAWNRTVKNLQNIIPGLGRCRVSLAVTTDGSRAELAAVEAVERLAKELGLGFRVSPLLPLGRSATSVLEPNPHPLREPGYLAGPAASCGLGGHLSVTAQGGAYPCHALTHEQYFLGDVFSGLSRIVESERFRELRRHTVDTTDRCRQCALRYLCGGVCHAWKPADQGLDAPVPDCGTAHDRARDALIHALEEFAIPVAQWQRAGLPLPDHAPGA
jgi:uncharacterized protein